MDSRSIGAFWVTAPVQTQSTKESIVEILKEIHEVTTTRPLTAEELRDAKDNIVKGFPQQFQTLPAIAHRMAELVIYDLPDDYWKKLFREVQTITTEMAYEAAKEHLRTDPILIVVVGDRQKIESKLEELGSGEVMVADTSLYE